jgi:hypothetical protein
VSAYTFNWHSNDDETEYTCRLEWPVEGMEPLEVEMDNRIETSPFPDVDVPGVGQSRLVIFFSHKSFSDFNFASAFFGVDGIFDFNVNLDWTTPAMLRAIADAAETLLPLAWECRPLKGNEQ